MKIKVPASELNRMMKALGPCIDPKDQNRSCIEISYDNNMLTARGTNGRFTAVMSTPLLGGDGEFFCVDGGLFARVCSMCSGDVDISTNGKDCIVKGAGRTRLPIVDAKIPEYDPVSGKKISIQAQAFAFMYNGTAFAISTDESRLVLTGLLTEVESGVMKITTLDGFKMASEEQTCDGETVSIIIPGAFAKLIKDNTVSGETITVTTDGKRIQAETDGMILSAGLLQGEYPDCKRILPTEFATEVLVNVDILRNALKNSSVICNTSKLVKLHIANNTIKVMGNSEQADYEAEIGCSMQGPELTIAFNQKYMVEVLNSITADEVVMKFNKPSTPCVITMRDGNSYRLVLPVRVV